MVFCHKCGTQQTEDSAFCRKCGAKLVVDDNVSNAGGHNVLNDIVLDNNNNNNYDVGNMRLAGTADSVNGTYDPVLKDAYERLKQNQYTCSSMEYMYPLPFSNSIEIHGKLYKFSVIVSAAERRISAVIVRLKTPFAVISAITNIAMLVLFIIFIVQMFTPQESFTGFVILCGVISLISGISNLATQLAGMNEKREIISFISTTLSEASAFCSGKADINAFAVLKGVVEIIAGLVFLFANEPIAEWLWSMGR